jgi:nicotinamidase-related amidase
LASYVSSHTPVVDKHIYTLFTPAGTRLVDERGWTDLYLCGIDTDSCVLKTAVDAFERDLTPWILQDACASHAGPEAHAAGLFIAGRFIGTNQLIQSASLPQSLLPQPA